MCASRQAMVVTGAGLGSIGAQSHEKVPSPLGRMDQQASTGFQKYSSSVRVSSRGLRWFVQCH